MKADGSSSPFAATPLPLPPRRRRGVLRCLCALCAWPWLTLIAVVATAVGLSMFDERMRDALSAAEDASTIIAGSGLRHWTAVARKCVTAATVLGATCLGSSLLAVVLASSALRTSRCSLSGCRPRPSLGRAGYVYAAATYSFLVALALVAALSASTIGAVGAKAAELVANYGASLTSQVATMGNSLASRAAPLASALGGGGAVAPPSAGCPTECFDAARYPFLNSKQCVCGNELLQFRDTMAHTFDVAVVGVVGAGVAAAALVLLWGTTAAHAARVWQLRCRSSSAAAAAANARGGDADVDDEFASSAEEQQQRRTEDERRGSEGDAVIHIAEWPPTMILPGSGSPSRRSSGAALPQGPQPWGPHAAYTWAYAPPSPGRHERTRSM